MKSLGNRILLFCMAIGIIAPFIVVAGVSIGASKTIQFPPEELSLRWYRVLFTDPEWLKAIGTSLLIAVSAALISVTLALAINYALWRLKSTFSHIVFALGLGPFLLPPIILALGASLSSQWQLFKTIVLPLIRPYLLTGFALVAIISVNEYLVANMISGFVVETLPIKIFNNVRYGYSPVVASASMLFVTITVGVLLLISRSTDLLALLGSNKSS